MSTAGFAYALACADDTFYIGKTKDIVTRFGAHKEGGSRASQWTKLHPAKSIVELANDNEDEFHELCLTLKYFQLYGTDRVRGGPFAGARLSDSDHPIIDMLSHELPFSVPRVVAVMACEDGRFFVESCPLQDLPERFASHAAGTNDCTFTRRFPVHSIVELVMDGPQQFEHLRLTLKMMFRHGIHNVRGSVFCTGDVQLSNAEVKLISRLIRCNVFPAKWSPPALVVSEDEEDDELTQIVDDLIE
jgi:predicted GIY-YIG superfamily endonuclease